jgi:hypothetical protein
VVSREGEPLEAPSVTLEADGVKIEIDPSMEAVHLPVERLGSISWADTPGESDASRPGGGAATKRPPDGHGRTVRDVRVELRSGECALGSLVSFDAETIILEDRGTARSLRSREVESIWFGGHGAIPLEALAPRPPPGPDRPLWRLGRNALGGPLRVGDRTSPTGVGLRAPAAIEIQPPSGARWLLAWAGASADAAPFAHVTLEVMIDGMPAARVADKTPGSPGDHLVLSVRGSERIAIRAVATADATGALGDFADAMFIE